MSPAFLDTNVLLRHLLQDVPEQSRLASLIMARLESGELTLRTTDTIVFETVYTMERTYRIQRSVILDCLMPILELPNLELEGKRLYRRIFELYLTTRVGFAECYHAALMEREGITDIFSFDRGFDRLPGIRRREA